MNKEELIKEKIDKLTAEWWGKYGSAIRRQAFADQILKLLSQQKQKDREEFKRVVEEEQEKHLTFEPYQALKNVLKAIKKINEKDD